MRHKVEPHATQNRTEKNAQHLLPPQLHPLKMRSVITGDLLRTPAGIPQLVSGGLVPRHLRLYRLKTNNFDSLQVNWKLVVTTEPQHSMFV